MLGYVDLTVIRRNEWLVGLLSGKCVRYLIRMLNVAYYIWIPCVTPTGKMYRSGLERCQKSRQTGGGGEIRKGSFMARRKADLRSFHGLTVLLLKRFSCRYLRGRQLED